MDAPVLVSLKALAPVLVAVLAMVLSGCMSQPTPAAPRATELQQADEAAAAVTVQPSATTGVVRGVVVDQAIHPVANVTVTLDDRSNVTTNAKGAFGFDNLKPGTHFLTTSRQDYTSVRQSVQVEAGVDHPEPVRIQIVAIPRATPSVDEYRIKMFVGAAAALPLAGPYNAGVTDALGEGTWSFLMPMEGNGTVAQFEFDWTAGSQLADSGQGHATTYATDDKGHRDPLDDKTVISASPVVVRLNATVAGRTSTEMAADFRAAPSGSLPVGAMANQPLDCFVHVFHNFVPDPAWQFGRDGAYPLPP